MKKELYDAGIDVTASAFVQQRNKLSWTVFEDAFEHFNAICNDAKKYKGYRVLAIDGTTVNMARNPKSDSFVQNDSNLKWMKWVVLPSTYHSMTSKKRH